MDLVTLLSKRPHNQQAALSRDNRDNFLSSSRAKDVPLTNQFSIHRQPSLMDDWRSKPGGGKRGFNISSSIVSLKIGHQSSEQGGDRPSKAQIGVESCRAVVANNGFDVHSFVSSQSIRRRDNVPGQLIEPSKPFLLRGDLATTYSGIVTDTLRPGQRASKLYIRCSLQSVGCRTKSRHSPTRFDIHEILPCWKLLGSRLG